MDTIISFLEKLVHYSAELGIVLAELAGIEPASEDSSIMASPITVAFLTFPQTYANRQA